MRPLFLGACLLLFFLGIALARARRRQLNLIHHQLSPSHEDRVATAHHKGALASCEPQHHGAGAMRLGAR